MSDPTDRGKAGNGVGEEVKGDEEVVDGVVY